MGNFSAAGEQLRASRVLASPVFTGERKVARDEKQTRSEGAQGRFYSRLARQMCGGPSCMSVIEVGQTPRHANHSVPREMI